MMRLVFVYNADSGVFNTLTDIAHKLISPSTYQCDLCSITHGVFRERDQWRNFIESLPVEVAFFHRDEFLERYSKDTGQLSFPCVLMEEGGHYSQLIDRNEISQCDSADCLSALVRQRLGDAC